MEMNRKVAAADTTGGAEGTKEVKTGDDGDSELDGKVA